MKKIRLKYPVIVEGRYDKSTLCSIFDAVIFPVGGFSVFNSAETKQLLRLISKDGVIILTDSDGGGRQIRSFLNGILDPSLVHNAYVPKVKGKEPRKSRPSKEGILGVEGLGREALVRALAPFAVGEGESPRGEEILPTDLYLAGLSGGQESSKRRAILASSFGLPPDLSAKAFLAAINLVSDKDGFLGRVDELFGG